MNRDDIKEFIELFSGYKKSSRMLAEAPDDDDDEGGLFGEEEDDAEEKEDSEEKEEKEDEEEEEKEDEVKVDKSDEVEFGKSLDDALNAIFVDIETDSLKSAKIQKQEESLSLKSMLLTESEEPSIDLEIFAAETARIIKNADTLLDIEKIILSKARDYLLSKYGEDEEKNFLEIMQNRFSIDARDESEKDSQEEIEAPIAIGAGGGAAGG